MRPDQLYRVPSGLTLEEAALSEPFAAVVHAVTEISPVRIGQKALISGPGPIGLLCLNLLVAQGVPAIVAGTAHDAARLEAATRFGAAAVVNVNEQSLAEAVAEFTGGLGVDATFECSGHPDSVRACLQSLRPMGHHTQVGVCGQSVSLPMDLIFSRQLTLAGSICYTEQTWDRMMHILAAGNIRLGDLVTDKLPISDWRTAFDLCKNRKALKVLMYPID
jgi:L-iditol 2-dehydrogenase